MKETLISILKGFRPNSITLKLFSIYIIVFFITLKNNPIETALPFIAPLQLYEQHETIAPYTPLESDREFGTKSYCKEAPAVFECARLYPVETVKNFSLAYIISAITAGLIIRFKDTGGEES